MNRREAVKRIGQVLGAVAVAPAAVEALLQAERPLLAENGVLSILGDGSTQFWGISETTFPRWKPVPVSTACLTEDAVIDYFETVRSDTPTRSAA